VAASDLRALSLSEDDMDHEQRDGTDRAGAFMNMNQKTLETTAPHIRYVRDRERCQRA
jgi:hypothetical protein